MIVPGTNEYDNKRIITGVAGRKGYSVVTIEKDMMNAEVGFGRKVLEVFEDDEISFEHLPSGIDTMSVVLETKDLEEKRERVLTRLQKAVRPDSISVEDGLALVNSIGGVEVIWVDLEYNITSTPGISFVD